MKLLIEMFWTASTVIGAAVVATMILLAIILTSMWLFQVISEASWTAYMNRSAARLAKNKARRRTLSPSNPETQDGTR